HRLERLLLATHGVLQRQLPGAHRRPGDLPGTDPDERHRLVRADGRHPGRGPPDACPVPVLRAARRQLHRLQWNQVGGATMRIRTTKRGTVRRGIAAVAGAAALCPAASGCGASGATWLAARDTVTYWLWDSNQLSACQACAKDFEKLNPGTTVRITQIG